MGLYIGSLNIYYFREIKFIPLCNLSNKANVFKNSMTNNII